MAAPTTQPCFRGQALSGLLDAARRVDGPGVDRALSDGASRALRDAVEELDARAWYPAQAHLELLDLLLEDVAEGDGDQLSDLACEAVHRDLHGTYRMLLKVASPSYVVGRADRILGAYLNYARVSVVERTLFSARLKFEVSPSSEALWAGIRGAIRGALEAAGAMEVMVEQEPTPDPDVCFYRARWS